MEKKRFNPSNTNIRFMQVAFARISLLSVVKLHTQRVDC